jgi:N-acetylmuramoyl-L-alanine amidase
VRRGPALLLCTLLLAGGCTAGGPSTDASPGVARAAPDAAGKPVPYLASVAPTPPATPSRRVPGRPPLAGKVIVVDPGHNGGNAARPEIINRLVDAYTQWKPCNTTGTQTPSGYPEHAFTWDVANRVAGRLRDAGARVVLTRTSDTGVGPCITERAAIGNRNRAAAVISVHADSAPGGGSGFHVLEPALIPGAPSTAVVAPSGRLAVEVRNQLRTVQPPAHYIGQDGLDVRSDMAGLNLTRVPAVMVECGNMADPADAARLTDPRFRERLAAALAAAVVAYLTRL